MRPGIGATEIGASITVDADDVAIDLNGFTIASGDYAIEIASGRTGARIRNGVIRDTFDAGISGNSADNVELRDLRIVNCFNSVNLNDHARMIDCVIDTSGEGAVSLQHNAFVRDCAFYRCSPGETALFVDDGSEVRDCVFIDNGTAISVRDNCLVAGNLCRSNAFTQVRVFGSGCRIEDNQLLDGQSRGLWITGNQVSGNIVRGNADNYDIDPGNQLNLLLSELPESIDWPASVKLTGTLTGIAGTTGITVNADEVTIDLDGHALIGVPGSLTGIAFPQTQRNIDIRNGAVREWGQGGVVGNPKAADSVLANLNAYSNGWEAASSGVGLAVGGGSQIRNCVAANNKSIGVFIGYGTVSECTARDNGDDGIAAGGDTFVTSCSANGNGGDGISAGAGGGDGSLISNCVANNNTSNGISAHDRSKVVDCTANGNSLDGISLTQYCVVQRCSTSDNARYGILANIYCRVSECVAEENTQDGFSVGSFSTVSECTATFNTQDGIRLGSDCRAANNTCSLNGFGSGDGAGIHATGSDNRIDGNTVTDNDRGLDVDSDGNLIVRNSASGNGANYSQVVSGNTMGEVVDTTTGGGTLDETHSPWANFSF